MFFDESDVNFMIRSQNSSLEVTQPSLDMNWMLGSQKMIQWTTGGDAVQSVKIEYTIGEIITVNGIDEVKWYTIAQFVPNTGSYVWNISGVPLSNVPPANANAEIRVSDATNSSVSDVSEKFYVTNLPSPVLVSATPNLNPNRISLVWTAPPGMNPADLVGYLVCRGADAISASPIASVVVGTLTFEDNTALDCIRYYYTIRARTTGGLISANSNSENAVIQAQLPFSITSPNGGEHWVAGTLQNITWKICDVNFTHAKIEYSLNGGFSWLTIASSVPNNGHYRWTVPSFASQNALVRVTNAAAPLTPTDQSDAVFEIIVLPPPNISSGTYHNLVLKPSTGTVSAWGYNAQGQVGDGTYGYDVYNQGIFRPTPLTISGLTTVKKISAGGSHSLALKNDGTVWAWGAGYSGQLGNNSTALKPTPQKIENCLKGTTTEPFSNITEISAGGQFSVALKSDGTVYCWGRNTDGEIGDDLTVNSLIPKKVQKLDNVAAISAGESIVLALKKDGTLWAWGTLRSYDNIILGIGNGDQAVRRIPTFLLSGVVSIAAHGEHVLIVKANGTVYSWGDNYFNQLGMALPPYYTTSPQQIPNFTNVTSVICGTNSSFALKNDGMLWGWGSGNNGLLGNGQYGPIATPMQITTNINGLKAITSGAANSLIYKSDGTICTSGINVYGVLGDPTVAINEQRNLFGCLNGNYSKSLPFYNSDYTLGRVNPLPEGETDSLQLRYRLMELHENTIHNDSQEELSVHPNPSSTSFTILLNTKTTQEVFTVSLSTVLGQVVYTTSLPSQERRCTINVGELPNGMYIVRVARTGHIISKSIIINH